MVTKNQVVSLDYCIKDLDGNTLESSEDGSLTYIHGHGQLPPTLEQALEQKVEGATTSVDFKAGECFGNYDEQLVTVMSRDSFEEGLEIKVGSVFQNMTDNGPQVICVMKIEGDEITVDANHPYADLDLTWEVTVLSSHLANQQEIDQGFPEGMAPSGGCCDSDSDCCDEDPAPVVEQQEGCCGSC
jgi:FKBP-type peptidyl-prolyl cis-trans isomerase SlyD